MDYKRVIGATRCNNSSFRGFRLNIRRFSIHKLRVRFLHLFKLLFKWRKSYDRAINSFKKRISIRRRNNNNNSSSSSDLSSTSNHHSKRGLISEERKATDCRLRSLCRTNSFYTEAIADCLEFIKRNSLSLDDIHRLHHHHHGNNEASPITATTLR